MITSLVVAPGMIGVGDTAIVQCEASDADGEPLLFEWVTDARLSFPGALSNTYLVTSGAVPFIKVFNPGLPNPISDTAWVRCHVYDTRGGSDTRRIEILLQ